MGSRRRTFACTARVLFWPYFGVPARNAALRHLRPQYVAQVGPHWCSRVRASCPGPGYVDGGRGGRTETWKYVSLAQIFRLRHGHGAEGRLNILSQGGLQTVDPL